MVLILKVVFPESTTLDLLSLVQNILFYKVVHFPSLCSRTYLAPAMDSWEDDASGMPWFRSYLCQCACLATTDGKCCCFPLIDHCPKHLRLQQKSQKREKFLFLQLFYFLLHLNFFKIYHAVLRLGVVAVLAPHDRSVLAQGGL